MAFTKARSTINAFVDQLWTYPVKSCQGIELQEAELSDTGFRWDRNWAVVRADGTVISQAELPQLATVEIRLGEALELFGPHAAPLTVGLDETNGEQLTVSVYTHFALAEVVSSATSEWFTELLGQPVQFVRMVERSRTIKETYRQPGATNLVSLANRFSVHVITLASLRALNERIDGNVPINQFRPNIVIGGEMRPYEEDTWTDFEIGKNRMTVVRTTARCPAVDTDQKTGARQRVVRRALAATRIGVDLVDPNHSTGLHFGQYVVHRDVGGTVRVGDQLRVVGRGSSNIELREGVAVPE